MCDKYHSLAKKIVVRTLKILPINWGVWYIAGYFRNRGRADVAILTSCCPGMPLKERVKLIKFLEEVGAISNGKFIIKQGLEMDEFEHNLVYKTE